MIYPHSSTIRYPCDFDFTLKGNEESWWKNEGGDGKGNAIQLMDDAPDHRFEVHVQS
ncbi:MAG TPA: hypothetical protein VFU29_08750 [Chitinophagaceae bacterium]|nr:hypothetical protein [Chitinophagaceae bacterium]